MPVLDSYEVVLEPPLLDPPIESADIDELWDLTDSLDPLRKAKGPDVFRGGRAGETFGVRDGPFWLLTRRGSGGGRVLLRL